MLFISYTCFIVFFIVLLIKIKTLDPPKKKKLPKPKPINYKKIKSMSYKDFLIKHRKEFDIEKTKPIGLHCMIYVEHKTNGWRLNIGIILDSPVYRLDWQKISIVNLYHDKFSASWMDKKDAILFISFLLKFLHGCDTERLYHLADQYIDMKDMDKANVNFLSLFMKQYIMALYKSSRAMAAAIDNSYAKSHWYESFMNCKTSIPYITKVKFSFGDDGNTRADKIADVLTFIKTM